jgi:hypothetical protein
VPYEFRLGKAGVRLKRAYSRKNWVAMRVRLFSQEHYCNFAYSALDCFRIRMSGSALPILARLIAFPEPARSGLRR